MTFLLLWPWNRNFTNTFPGKESNSTVLCFQETKSILIKLEVSTSTNHCGQIWVLWLCGLFKMTNKFSIFFQKILYVPQRWSGPWKFERTNLDPSLKIFDIFIQIISWILCFRLLCFFLDKFVWSLFAKKILCLTRIVKVINMNFYIFSHTVFLNLYT